MHKADFACADELVVPKSIGTAIVRNSLEHMPRVWETPRILRMILEARTASVYAYLVKPALSWSVSRLLAYIR